MPWGDPGVTRLRRQADQSITYATGVNTPQTLQHVGLLKKLRLITSLNVTNVVGNGAVVQDTQGPWNLFANMMIRVSGLDLLFQVSGWGLYLINLINNYQYAPNAAGIATANTANQQTVATDIFSYPAAGAQAAQTLLFNLDLPFTAPLLGFEDLGLWLIQNETVNMEVVPTYNALGGANNLQQPYVLTGTATATVNSGNTAVWRDFYGVPSQQSDMPPLGYVHQWEEQFNAITGNQVDIDHQRGGVLLRLIYQIDDADSTGGGNNVLAGITNANVNGIEFKYDANDTPFDESAAEILARQRELYGRDLPVGTFTHDFFSQTKTLQDSYNTEAYINVKTRFRFAKALVAGSRIRTIRERLLPVVLNTTG
jgi:hypothetical protein